MQLEFQITKDDYIDLYHFKAKQKLTKNLALIVLISILIAITGGGKPFNWWTALTSLFFLPAIWCVLYVINYYRTINRFNKLIATDQNLSGKKSILITEEGLQITYITEDIKTLKWGMIMSVESAKKAIYLTLIDKNIFIIPKRSFLSDLESVKFKDEIGNQIFKIDGGPKAMLLKSQNRPSYLIGLACFIPLIGAFIGVWLLISGIFNYKNKWFIIMGIGGIAFTVTIYSSLYFYVNSESNRKTFAPLFQGQLNTLMKEVEFYKLQHGVYPDSLGQLKFDDKSISIGDQLQSMNDKVKNKNYNYKKIGNKYYLFSSGVDGIPNTTDDIYPKMSPADTSKFGLIIK